MVAQLVACQTCYEEIEDLTVSWAVGHGCAVVMAKLWLGRQRQVWFILLADERGACR